jgi:hypothetical protein
MAAITIVLILPASICLSVAGYMAINQIGGWGWFLTVGLLLGAFRYSTNQKADAND